MTTDTQHDDINTPVNDAPTPPQPAPENRPSMGLVVFLVVPLVGILVALVMIATSGQNNAAQNRLNNAPEVVQRNAAALINFTAPDFALTDLDGNPVSMADYAGKTLFLNFWQTTCAPCVRELPAFADFAAASDGDAVAVLAVNFDETSQDVRNFFSEYDISGVPVALDPDSSVRRTYGVVQIPVTFIITPDGVVRQMHLGEMTFDDMEQYLVLVEYQQTQDEAETGG